MRGSMVGAAGLGLVGGMPLAAIARPDTVRLTILHTNDLHSRIEPLPDDGRRYGGMGGLSRLASLVRQIREQEEQVLLLDAGDVFQGTPYFNFFGGELEYKLMTQMGYDASTLGNHDFDNGLEGLEKMLPFADFPFLTANYDFSRTRLQGRFAPYKVFTKEGIRVGVFGLGIQLAGLVSPNLSRETVYLDPVTTARETVAILREQEKCQLVVCLSHLGYRYESGKIDDRKLAVQVSGIDLILGGHTHTFMPSPEDITAPDGHQTLINQVGWSGIHLGRVDYGFSRRSGRVKSVASTALPVGPIAKT